ncbi:hypothetical protein BD309DRAFT_967165 [Dichomitus squalens]|nr:hypothetical protein BD309DRAFT_967165 [Dichomitus squalens]
MGNHQPLRRLSWLLRPSRPIRGLIPAWILLYALYSRCVQATWVGSPSIPPGWYGSDRAIRLALLRHRTNGGAAHAALRTRSSTPSPLSSWPGGREPRGGSCAREGHPRASTMPQMWFLS